MNAVKINYKLTFRISLLIFCVVFAVHFPNTILYLFLSFIFSLIGRPIARKISDIKIFKHNIHYTLSSLIVVVLFVIIFLTAMLFFIPMLIKELRVLENINYDALSDYFSNMLMSIQQFLYNNNFIEENQTLIGLMTEKLKNFINIDVISTIFGEIVNSTGVFFFGLFSVVFMTFFFIKDDIRLVKLAPVFFNQEYIRRVIFASNKINKSLSRYCAVTFINTFVMIVLLYLALLLLGVKGAFLMALIGGVLNIIPYIGPIVGCAICCLFGIINCVGLEMYTTILPVIVKIIATFVLVNGVDNIVVLPMMYSKSIKLHPIESFLITIIGGKIAGIAGMLLGIPVYTIFRIIVIEIYLYINSDNENK